MKKDYNSKKKATIAALSLVAVCLVVGLFYFVGNMGNEPPLPTESKPPIETEVVVPEIKPEVKPESNRNPDKLSIIRLCEELLRLNTLLFDTLKQTKGIRYEKGCYQISLDYINIATLRGIDRTLRSLSLLFFTLDYEKKVLYNKLVHRMEEKIAKITVLLDYSQHIHWIELIGALSCRICSLPKQLDFLLHEDIWSKDTPYILTSGTLSVGGDFTHFKRRNGIAMVEDGRLFEGSYASPFDYQENALLYLPKDMPLPQSKDSNYLQAVTQRLAELIAATHGHTLILFTSYRQMEQTYNALQGMITDYPLFMMGKGRLDALDSFRKSGNGVLFASDSAGEAIDLAGDILSSLIVVRLPFPVPDPVLEYEKTLYSDFYSYLNEVIVPEMLTKLRQWIGRGIRRETDTCVLLFLIVVPVDTIRTTYSPPYPICRLQTSLPMLGGFCCLKRMAVILNRIGGKPCR